MSEVPDGEGFDLDECVSDSPLKPLKDKDPMPKLTLGLLQAAVEEERKSVSVCVDHGVIHACGHFAHMPEATDAALALLNECMDVDRRAMLTLLKDVAALNAVTDILTTPSNPLTPLTVHLVAGIVRDVAIDVSGRKVIVKRYTGKGLVGGVGRSVTDKQIRTASWNETVETVAGALANLAIAEELRPEFTQVRSKPWTIEV